MTVLKKGAIEKDPICAIRLSAQELQLQTNPGPSEGPGELGQTIQPFSVHTNKRRYILLAKHVSTILTKHACADPTLTNGVGGRVISVKKETQPSLYGSGRRGSKIHKKQWAPKSS